MLTPGARSELMARITGDDLGPETALRAALRRLRWRVERNRRDLPGSPDVVLPTRRLAVFVHGCFWHGCPAHYRAPRSRREFWLRKMEANRRRDARVRRQLRRLGWRTMVVWEHETRRDALAAAERVARRARSSR
jgi:DNA mismatch endonuclease (patch repair protein)